MHDLFGPERRRDFLRRGFTRRDFARIAALATAGAALPFYNEATLAQGLSAANLPTDAVRINANENPMGPCPEAIEAIHKVVEKGGRYLYEHTFAFVAALAEVESLPRDHVLPFAGSSDPLHRAVLAFAGPSKGVVVADPGYEAAGKAAEFLGAKVTLVPLRKDGSHDPQAMATADPSAGLIYICNPNNPTGTVTRKEDIDYIIANKPKGTIVLLDEAYIHLSSSAESGCAHVAADKDVVILRTFSKLYGMAGLRAGAAFGRPDLLEKIRHYSAGALPVTGMVGATASLKAKGLVESRRKVIADIRDETAGWLDKKGYSVMPSEANMLMIDVRRPGRQVFTGMLAQGVAIGRTWPSMPNHVRVSIGTRDEMAKFRVAFARVMNA
jgi:histidinol-phosphate aminotransferase